MNISNKIVLGTAQFGMDYGIANVNGKPKHKQIFDILDLAWEKGVRRFDTAPDYGSDVLLGEFIKVNKIENEVLVLTKISSLNNSADFQKDTIKNLELSIKNLGCPINVLFFHDPRDSLLLLNKQEFFENLVSKYSISSLGVSVYDNKEVEQIESCDFDLAFQFPFNVLDRRFEKVKMPVGKRYARSIFLQGLLVSKNKLRLNSPLDLIDLQTKYHNKLNDYDLNPINFAFSFVANSETADYVLLGVDNADQLNEIFSQTLNSEEIITNLNDFVLNIDKNLLDPRTWN